MKSYKEMAENVLKRRDEAIAKRKIMIVRLQRTSVLAACFVLITVLGFMLLQSGVFRGGELAPSSLPAASQQTDSTVVSNLQPVDSANSPTPSESASADSDLPAPADSSQTDTASARTSNPTSSTIDASSQNGYKTTSSTPNRPGTTSKDSVSSQTSPIKSNPSHAASYYRPNASTDPADPSGQPAAVKPIKRSFISIDELIDYVQEAGRDTIILPQQGGYQAVDSDPEQPAADAPGGAYGDASRPYDSRDWDAIWPLFQYGTVPRLSLPADQNELALRWCAINRNILSYQLQHYAESDDIRTVIGEMDVTLFADKDEGLTRLNNIRNREHEEFDMHGTTYYAEKTTYGYCIVWVAHQAPQLDTYCMVKYYGNETLLQQILSYLLIEWIPF